MSTIDRLSLVALALALPAGAALAQATVKDDGAWRAALGAAFSHSSGNTRSTSVNLLADAVRASKQDKWALYASALYGRTGGSTSANQWRLGTKYDWNLSERFYVFGLGELEGDEVAGLSSRLSGAGGAGWRIVRTPETSFEVFAGAGHVSDRYSPARLVDGAVRSSYGYPSLLLGEESNHKLGASTTARQRLVLTPNLKNSGDYRAQWDGALGVAVSATFNLTAGLTVKYNSDPGAGVRSTDTLLTTGVAVKFE